MEEFTKFWCAFEACLVAFHKLKEAEKDSLDGVKKEQDAYEVAQKELQVALDAYIEFRIQAANKK
jgi:hypothetical protein